MSDLKWYSGEKVYGGTTLFPANRYFLRNGQFIDAYYHDAIVADKDKIIADLKRQLEDVRDNAFEEAALILENNVCNLNKSGELISEPRYGKEDVVRRSYANVIRALKSNQK